MRINVINADGTASATALQLCDGTLLPYAERVVIESRQPGLVVVHATFAMPLIDINGAELRIEESHLRALAEAHGFYLTKIPD